MLSIKAMTGGVLGEYYLSLSREDYYLEGGEPPGEWLGLGASKIGLSGEVGREELKGILKALDPFSGEKLAQNGGDAARHSGWDLTFSAPKSVSVLWALSDFETRKSIERAHENAVKSTLKILEEGGIVTRRGKGGARVERGYLVAASFLHGTSRELDPQLHSHCVVSNLCVRSDGTVGTIVGRELYKRKMALGGLYRAELSQLLIKEFDISLSAKKGVFEVRGVSEKIVALFSKRRARIERELLARGLSGAKASEKVALLSRDKKRDVSRKELYELWKEEAIKEGLNVPVLKRRNEEPSETPFPPLPQMFDELTQSQSTFTRWEVIKKLCEEVASIGKGASSILERAAYFLKEHPDVVFLGKHRLERTYTTGELLAAEDTLLSMFGENLPSSSSLPLSAPSLSREGEAALNFLLEVRPLSVISGLAGTGKTSLLKKARLALEKANYSLLGASVSGKAAEGLESATGIKSSTIFSLLKDLDSKRLSLSPSSILVIDEAGMLGTLEMLKVCKFVKKAGAKLILVGDEKQLQPIAAGCAFASLGRRYGQFNLVNIQRQRSQWDKDRVLELSRGEAEKSFKEYAKNGRLKVLKDDTEAKIDLISTWGRAGVSRPEANLLLASEKTQVAELNLRAQAARALAGVLGKAIRGKGLTFHIGDRVLFTRNLRLIGVKNGSLGTILSYRRLTGRFVVLLDNGRKILTRPSEHMTLGYAVTTHKAQGITAENAYVLLGGCLQDREVAYVQASRARGETHFALPVSEAGEDLKKIAYRASESRRKLLAREVQAVMR